MKDIHVYVYGSNVFATLLIEIGTGYSIFFKEENNSEDSSDIKDVVRIIFPEKLKLYEFKKLLKNGTPTLVMLENKNFLKENKLVLLSFQQSLLLPIDIFSLKEIITIIITKYKFFKNSKTIIDTYQIDSNQKIISTNGLDKPFLLKKVWNYNKNLESHAFETHLHRLRQKIKKYFKDNKFIVENNSLYYLCRK